MKIPFTLRSRGKGRATLQIADQRIELLRLPVPDGAIAVPIDAEREARDAVVSRSRDGDGIRDLDEALFQRGHINPCR